VGAGNFAQSYLLPPMKGLPVLLKSVVTGTPVNAKSVARKFGFQECGTDHTIVVNDPAVRCRLQHADSHAGFVADALKKESMCLSKPLA
jgi:predicted dehydrogenase